VPGASKRESRDVRCPAVISFVVVTEEEKCNRVMQVERTRAQYHADNAHGFNLLQVLLPLPVRSSQALEKEERRRIEK
jgi:hypothetical protein